MDKNKESYEYLRKVLDASYERNKETYERSYSSIRDFYFNALKTMNSGNFSFITSNFDYRNNVSSNFYNLVRAAYDYSVMGNVKVLGSEPTIELMIYELSESFEKSHIKDNSRVFEKNAIWLDEQLNGESVSKKKKILENILLNESCVDLKKNKRKELYNADKFELIVLLTENAYRICHICNNVTGSYTINFFNENNESNVYDPNRIRRYEIGRKKLNQLMYGFDDVASYIRNLDNEQIRQMIELYVISRDYRKNKSSINAAYTINTTEETINISDQFKDKNLYSKIYGQPQY